MSLSRTLSAAPHLEMEPQSVLGPLGVLSDVDVVLQAVVCSLGKPDVASLKVTAEGEVA